MQINNTWSEFLWKLFLARHSSYTVKKLFFSRSLMHLSFPLALIDVLINKDRYIRSDVMWWPHPSICYQAYIPQHQKKRQKPRPQQELLCRLFFSQQNWFRSATLSTFTWSKDRQKQKMDKEWNTYSNVDMESNSTFIRAGSTCCCLDFGVC